VHQRSRDHERVGQAQRRLLGADLRCSPCNLGVNRDDLDLAIGQRVMQDVAGPGPDRADEAL